MICGVNVFGVLFAARFISLLSLRELRYLECDCFVTRTLDLLFIVHVRRCMMTQHILFPPIIYVLWIGRQGRSRSQSGNVGVSSETERQRERSRIEMQLEEVKGKVGIVDS